MSTSLEHQRDTFIECRWRYDASPESHYGYISVTQDLRNIVREKSEKNLNEQAEILELLARSTSMMLFPTSINDPFKPYLQDYQAGQRSSIPEDFSVDDLAFFALILDDIDEPWLKARLADLLWLSSKPRSPMHAKIAIESYTSHSIEHETWQRDIGKCWERAITLCMQIKDYDQLGKIKKQLFISIETEYPSSKHMALWIAELMHKSKLDRDYVESIATTLLRKGKELQQDCDYHSARSYFEMAEKKYKQFNAESSWLECLISIADCFEGEADSRLAGSNMAANAFYENAIQAFRRIPTKHRETYDVNDRVKIIRTKLKDSGKASLDELKMLETPGIDISELVKSSKEHVSGKRSLEDAMMCFSGLYSGPDYNNLASNARENIQQSPIGSLFGSSQIGSDGRIVGRTPPMNPNAGDADPANQSVLNQQLQQQLGIAVQLAVEGKILPALGQILMEHRVSKDFLAAMCSHSPLVPEGRECLLGHALSLGFEYDFGSAIHLLCPQVEHIVRTHLKDAGAHTSNIDREGIENENGLSTLLDLPEATEVFGIDLVFELKSVFTDSMGFNLRNEVAHGLIDDDTSSSISTIYAWWMILRLVLRSILDDVNRQQATDVKL